MTLSSWKATYKDGSYQLSKADANRVLEEITVDAFSAYTTLRTFNKAYVYRLKEHFQRLEHSAQLMGRKSKVDEQALRIALSTILAGCPNLPDYRIRIYFRFDEPYGTIYIQIHALTPPTPEEYKQGVRCVTCIMQRNSPKAKLTQFMPKAEKVRSTLPGGIYEAIMKTEEGEILEGISSNFYVVINSKVYTAEKGVLGGIVRGMILEIMQAEKIPYLLKSISDRQIFEFEEAFITSSGRGVLPVRELDGIQIGNGKPGVITKSIMAVYADRLIEEFELILPESDE